MATHWFVKRPVHIAGVRFTDTPESWAELELFVGVQNLFKVADAPWLCTLHGPVRLHEGDWVMLGPPTSTGEVDCYPITEQILHDTHDSVAPGTMVPLELDDEAGAAWLDLDHTEFLRALAALLGQPDDWRLLPDFLSCGPDWAAMVFHFLESQHVQGFWEVRPAGDQRPIEGPALVLARDEDEDGAPREPTIFAIDAQGQVLYRTEGDPLHPIEVIYVRPLGSKA